MRLGVRGSALAALLLGGVAACWTAAARGERITIEIGNLAFAPAAVTVHVGDTVTWVNGDFIAHTATARSGAWDVQIPSKASRSIVLKTAGTVDYYCKFHPQMTGKITVAP